MEQEKIGSPKDILPPPQTKKKQHPLILFITGVPGGLAIFGSECKINRGPYIFFETY